jgi:hypothetical protein
MKWKKRKSSAVPSTDVVFLKNKVEEHIQRSSPTSDEVPWHA